jgi:hypothetical protein
MERAVENAFAELCLGPEIHPNDSDQVQAWLARHEMSDSDRSFLIDQGVERLLVYRRLVRGTLRDAVALAIPRTLKRLGHLFDESFSEFLSSRGPRTHYLRDVTDEFLAWAHEQWVKDDRIPPYAWELARHEALRIELGAMPSRGRRGFVPALEPDQPIAFIEAARIVECSYRVHELSESEDDRTEPVRGNVSLLAYRSPEHEVRYLELSAMAATILAGLIEEGQTLRSALEQAAEQHGRALDDRVIQSTAELLADLAARGVLLGASGASG